MFNNFRGPFTPLLYSDSDISLGKMGTIRIFPNSDISYNTGNPGIQDVNLCGRIFVGTVVVFFLEQGKGFCTFLF